MSVVGVSLTRPTLGRRTGRRCAAYTLLVFGRKKTTNEELADKALHPRA